MDVNDYVKIAVELGVNPDFRHEIRTQLQRFGREVFEDQQAVSEHERIFEELLSTSR